MRPIIYARESLIEGDELQAIQSVGLQSTFYLHNIEQNDLVIARYSVLPFYKDTEAEILLRGGKLLNTYEQHRYVADIANWYEDLKDFTPETWFDLSKVPTKGPYIMKGRTNSRKGFWKDLMYAETFEQMIDIGVALNRDPLISEQGVCCRRYVPLKTFGTSVGGCPISEEYRFFCLNGQVLSGGFYWSQHSEYLKEEGLYPDIEEQGPDLGFVYQVLEIIEDKIPFVVIDIARTITNEWTVIELNDGQMSGLADIVPEILYKNIKEQLDARL